MVLDQVDQIQIVKLVTLGGCHLKKCICMLYRPFFHNVNLWENVSWVQCASRDGAESYNSKVCLQVFAGDYLKIQCIYIHKHENISS